MSWSGEVVIAEMQRLAAEFPLEEALAVVTEYVRLDSGFTYPSMSRVVFLQALGRAAEVQEAVRKTRKVAPGEGLDFWLGLVSNSYFAESDKQTFAQHFTDAWNAMPEDVS